MISEQLYAEAMRANVIAHAKISELQQEMLAVQCGEKLGLNDDPGFDIILRGNISTELELWKELAAACDKCEEEYTNNDT